MSAEGLASFSGAPRPWAKLGLIAGEGDLPVALAAHCRNASIPLHVSRIDGVSDPRLSSFEGATHGIAAIGERIKALKADGVDAVVFAGNVKRPDFAQLKPDLHGAMALPRIIAEARRGDDALLRAVMAEFEKAGFKVVGAEAVLEELVAPAGPFGSYAPDASALLDIRKAATVAAEIGRLDIGQAVVVADGLVLAVEAQEGTDQMLERVAALRPDIRGTAQTRRGVLLKRPKPQQERRVDLPTIGLATLERADAAGLKGIAVEAGAALVMDRQALPEAADRAGLFVFGFSDDDWAGAIQGASNQLTEGGDA